MKYFAMIDGERRGPFTLDELHSAGVMPDTYVWCKGMDDWEKAEDVADICRFYRQRIFDLMHPSQADRADNSSANTPLENEDEDENSDFPIAFRRYFKGAELPTMNSERNQQLTRQPSSLIPISLILMILCCPLTGCIAFYYALRSRQAWKEAHRSNDAHKELYSDAERQALSRKAYEYSRLAKMWCGITFFFGFFIAALISKGILG
ncbi:MAG: GYF domain-containing protein [Muribaculaceae bacterium]|nr:GYF domain-containing protein [Muribaculaceae bacterium]